VSYTIHYEETAEDDLRRFRRHELRRLFDEIEAQLTTAPSTEGRRKKLLEGLVPPWDAVRPAWQLRVGDVRVFYDVDEERAEVVVRAVRRKGRRTTGEIL